MKNIIKFLFTTVIIAMAASCSEKGPGQTGNESQINENIEFTVKTLGDPESTSAKIRVEHNGTEADTWYGFETKEKDMMKAYNAKVQELLAAGEITGLNNKTTQTIQLENLDPNTDYQYIVFAITSEGEVYGVPESVVFKTAKGTLSFVENNNWKVYYTGEYKDEATNEVLYKHTVTVETNDENKFFLSIFNKASLGSYDIKDPEILSQVIAMEYESFAGSFQSTQQMSQYLYNQSTTIAVDNSVYAGDWYFIAIGIGDDYQLSGYYAISEVVNIPEEEATPEYEAWLGDWVFTGENGVAFNVTFKHGINNMYYLMSGWEGISEEFGADIPVYWDAEAKEWFIANQYYYTAEWEQFGKGDLWLFGADEEYVYTFTNQQVGICYSETAEDGTRKCNGYNLNFEDGSSVSIKYMQYVILFENSDDLGTVTEATEWPSFPATITRNENPGTTTQKNSVKSSPVVLNKKAKNAQVALPFVIKNNISIR